MILDDIIVHKRIEIEQQKRNIPFDDVKRMSESVIDKRDFKGALSQKGKVNLIAEIKKASPSKGIIRQDFDPSDIACIYEQNGASAISVLTDQKFFQGDLSFLKIARSVTSSIPLLRKDFIIDEYQVFQSKMAGADAILLIASVLEKQDLINLLAIAESIGLDCLVEVHTEEELRKVLQTNAEIIGINNRDLRTFKTDTQTTARLTQIIPNNKVVVAESGITSSEDVRFLKKCGVQAMLVGEAIMASKNIALKVKQLTNQTVKE
ncbi:TPA: indole-3-glycerol phosphate synthase TrpC [bacterium]|nr:indole-3-glycerol phosphate synthase TrpC [bacterium]